MNQLTNSKISDKNDLVAIAHDCQKEEKSVWNVIQSEFTEDIHTFETLDVAFDFLTSSVMANKLRNFKKTFLIRLKIENDFEEINDSKLTKFTRMCSLYSVILVLSSTNNESLALYWKSSQVDYFLKLNVIKKNSVSDVIELYGFIVDLLTYFLTKGHIGKKEA